MAPGAEPRALSLTQGGPLYLLERRLGLAPTDTAHVARLALALVGIAWVPAIVLGVGARALGAPIDTLLTGTRMHVRLLVGIPLLVLAEVSLERRGAAVAGHLLKGGVLPQASREAFLGLASRLGRLRDAKAPELLIALAVYALTALSVVGALPDPVLRWLLSAGHRIGVGPRFTAPSIWYLVVGEPLYAFLIVRWLLRWLLWAWLLSRLPRLGARAQPAHADRAGGLAFLGSPLFAIRFAALSLASSLAAIWFDEITARRVMPAEFAGDLVAFFLAALSVAVLPYLSLTPYLVEAKRAGLLAYSALVQRYVERFDAHWIAGAGGDPLAESENFSGLTDIGTSFEVVVQMRPTIFDWDELRAQTLATLLPFVPILVVHAGSAADLVMRLVERFF